LPHDVSLPHNACHTLKTDKQASTTSVPILARLREDQQENSKRKKMNSPMTTRTSRMSSTRSKRNNTMTTRTNWMSSKRSKKNSTMTAMISTRTLNNLSKWGAAIQASRSLGSAFGTEATLWQQLVQNCHRLTTKNPKLTSTMTMRI
jgi:hypothetical protein